MKNKTHKHILKAFIEIKIPDVIRRDARELIVLDSTLGGYCDTAVTSRKNIDIYTDEIISRSDKVLFDRLISNSANDEKDELIIYYRLAILAESILYRYRAEKR